MMEPQTGLLVVLAFGFLLGLKHATDADHVVAVASIVSKENSLLASIWIGASWGLGHSIPLLIVGSTVLIAKDIALDRFEAVSPYLEFGVGIMLIYLGISTVWNVLRNKMHIHTHNHGEGPHIHVHASHAKGNVAEAQPTSHNSFYLLGKPVLRVKSFAIGMVHGLAGSAAVMVALLPSITSMWAGAGYLMLFSVGTMLSMAGLTILLALPFKASGSRQRFNRSITAFAGFASISIGGILITEIVLGIAIMPF